MRKARWCLIASLVLVWGSLFTMGHYGVPWWGSLGASLASMASGALACVSGWFLATEEPEE